METAGSGEEGLEKKRQGNYDLIFLDLKMPGINGVETLRGIREEDPEVPVYIVTAFHEEFFEELKKASSDGVQFDLMRKPLGADQILEVADGLLS